MTMITLINQAKASAEAFIANRELAIESFSETLQDGNVVTCIPVCSSNAFETTIGHIKITWKLNGGRTTAATVEKLYKAISTPEDLAEIKRWKENQAWLKKFGL